MLFDAKQLKKLYIPSSGSHKGQNGKLLIIAGSKLFHAPAIWPAQIASRIVDMVYVASAPENNKVLQELKGKFWDGIVIRRKHLADYVEEADCILIGPGLPREEGLQEGDDDSRKLVKHVLYDLLSEKKSSQLDIHVDGRVRKKGRGRTERREKKRVVIDGGALQVMELDWIPPNAILTPHRGEWRLLQKIAQQGKHVHAKLSNLTESVQEFAKQHECIVLLKGQEDIICSPTECRLVKGGNAGMTKGGTGDVLAGLVAALACKNDPFLAACAGSYLNKAAADSLYPKVGYYFNSSDLVEEIPKVMKKLVV